MSAGRVLNFSEFFTKYSKDGKNNQKALADFAKASASFQDAFDETTYKQNDLGPNKPVEGSTEMTPAQPGETGSPVFKADSKAPSPEDIVPSDDSEKSKQEIESPEKEVPEQEKTENPEEEEDENKEESEETPEPEANESIKELKGFSKYIKEDYVFGNSEEGSTGEQKSDDENFTAGLGHTDNEHIEDDEVICQSCGSHKPLDGNSPEEDSWFTHKFGMQCGCK